MPIEELGVELILVGEDEASAGFRNYGTGR
jgi:hypothetical protein